MTSSRNAIENLLKQAQNGVSIGSQTIKTDLSQFKQDLKNTNLPGADDGDNAADSDTVIDYSEATPPSDTDPVDPNYTLSPSQEPAQSADLSTPDESSTAAQDTAPAQEPAAEGGEADRTSHGQPGPEAVDDSADSTVVSEDDGTATKPDERYPIDPDYTHITEGLDDLPDTKDVLNDISDALPDSVDVEIPKVELTNRDAITASRNDLSSSLTSMGDIVSSLNNNASSNSQALINDVKAISKQINKIGQTLSGASENVNRDADDIVDDVSDDDTDDDVEAKVTNCINSGTVNADLNAGGITGAMARENDLDPEDDYTTAGSESLNFTFKTRVVTRDCTNYGTVSAKKQNAGGIVGDAEMGSVIDCRGFGTLDAEDATGDRRRGRYQQVHDPRELRQGPPVRCKAGRRHCRSGATIENCRAMVMIDNAAEQIGAIAGIVDDPLDGSVTGNTFVDGGVAGIDSVSYQALPNRCPTRISSRRKICRRFGSICVRFVTDEDSLVQEYHIPYGSDFPTDQLPPVPFSSSQTATWYFSISTTSTK